MILAILGFVAITFKGRTQEATTWRPRRRKTGRPPATPAVPAGHVAPGYIDVAGLELAIDWRARRVVQARLDELAREGDTSTAEGLVQLARATARTLLEVEVSWLYAAAVSTRALPMSAGERLFRESSTHARSKFRHEVIRNANGAKRSAKAPTQRASREEGEGVVVVTFLVAAHRLLSDVNDVTDARQLRHLLGQVIALEADTLAVLEVIWSPAEDNDRLSTAEMEELYPELRQMDERDIVGRVFCGHCSAPYAAELLACPSCGAGVEHARRRGAPV